MPLRLASELSGDGALELPPASELVLIRAEGPAWFETLAVALTAAGIRSRVELLDPERVGARSGVSGTACALFVRPKDEARAREIDAAVHRDQVPDLEHAESVEGHGEGCPACGHAVPDDATDCPDCGLTFV